VANLLSTAVSVNNAVAAAENIDVSGSSLENAGINAAFSAAAAITSGQNPFQAAANSAIGSIPGASSIASAANSVLGLAGSPLAGAIGGLYGTKPLALHTEYAAGSADWSKPYGSGTDITFYLMRADGGGGGEGGGGNPTVAGDSGGAPGSLGSGGTGLGATGRDPSKDQAKVSADITAGAGLPDGMQSVMSQVASATLVSTSVSRLAATTPSLAGPFTGIIEELSTSDGYYTSATSAVMTSKRDNVIGALRATSAINNLGNTLDNSRAASEAFFHKTLNTAFDASEEMSLSNVPVSEFSSLMAFRTGGVTSTTDFIAGINDGLLGFTSTSSAANAARTGPQGTPKKKS
jgi:hypothetical protein